MDKKQINELSEKIVLATFADNEEQIIKDLAENLSWEDGWEKSLSIATYNAVKTSTVLSVQILLDILLKTGLFKISEEITRPHLELLQGGLNHE